MSLISDTTMLLHNYLEEIFGSRTRVIILRVLFKHPHKIFTGRELAKLTNVSKSAVAEAVTSLEAMNIIKVEHHGQSNLVTLNKFSAIHVMLKNLFKEEAETFNNLIETLKLGATPKQIISIAVFGSVAEGTEKPNSDIDLLFITSDKKAAQKFIDDEVHGFTPKYDYRVLRAGKFSHVITRYGNVIVPYIVTEKEFVKKKNTLFIKNILNKYVLVAGVDLWKILKQEK